MPVHPTEFAMPTSTAFDHPSPETASGATFSRQAITKRKVLVCRTALLPYSETFIREQVLACSRWRALLIGLSRVNGLALDGVDTRIMMSEQHGWIARWRQRLWQALHWLPGDVAKRLHAEQADLVHIHFGVDAVNYWPAVKSLGLPVVITLHGYDINRHASSWGHPLRAPWSAWYPRRLLHIARQPGVHFIAVSEAIRRRAIDYGIAAERISVQYIGVDTQRFCPGGKPIALRRRILFVGRLVEKKGAQILLRAFARVRKLVADAELTVIGDGPLMADLRAHVEQQQLPVRFLGSVSSDEIKRQIDAARVFCLPSITARDGDAEGLGLALLEAQACGVPVVTSARGGATEGMIDGITGFAFSEGDEAALAEELIRLLSDDDLVTTMSVAARHFVVNKFNLQRCTHDLEALYDRLANPVYERASTMRSVVDCNG